MHPSTPSRGLRRALRGVTLVEVLIVVSIMAMIATAVTVAVIPQWMHAREELAITNANAIRHGAEQWRVRFAADDCPTTSRLLADKVIDASSKTEDPWGTPYAISCQDDSITVISAGPDRKVGTPDDIHVPPPTKTAGP